MRDQHGPTERELARAYFLMTPSERRKIRRLAQSTNLHEPNAPCPKCGHTIAEIDAGRGLCADCYAVANEIERIDAANAVQSARNAVRRQRRCFNPHPI